MSASTLLATDAWRSAFPGAIAATLTVRGLINLPTTPALDDGKRDLEARLRETWAGKTRTDLRAEPVLAAYDAYYKRFGQNYHVQMQIESIALKGKAIPSRAAIVEAMFMAELSSGVLAAVHDLEAVCGAVIVDHTTGDERYTRYDGAEETCKPGDMAMRDETGILTSVIQGPTTLARVTEATTNALFCLYAPPGVGRDAVNACLADIAQFIRFVAPDAQRERPVIVE